MTLERIRTVIGDIANTAAVVVLAVGVVGYLGGANAFAVGAMVTAAVAASLTPFVLRPPRSLGILERRALGAYLHRELARCRIELPAGVTPDRGITLGDFLTGGSLYAEPTVEVMKGVPLSGGFVDWIVAAAKDNQRVLMLGDPGQGKTLSCRLAYVHLVHAYRAKTLPVVPLFVRLADLRDHLAAAPATSDPALALARLLTTGHDPLPIAPSRIVKLLHHGRFVFILDGLDELAIHGTTRREVIPAVLKPALEGGVILSCRRAFYDLYLHDSATSHNFDAVALLEGVDFATSGRRFVHRYCERFGLDTADSLVKLIEESGALRDLVTRPLILFMTTDVLAHKFAGVPGGAPHIEPTEWTVAEVYEHYARKWLHLEQEKGAVLWQDMEALCEAVAWRIFELAFDGRKAFGMFEVSDLVINETSLRAVVDECRHPEPRRVFAELTARSFLIAADRDEYFRFAHKSFFEYFVARRVRTMLTGRHDDVVRLVVHLAAPLPDEIIDFLRQMLHRCAAVPTDCGAIRENLFRILDETIDVEQTDEVVMLRQQAGNLAPTVLVDDAVGKQRLLALYGREAHPFVRRGIVVGMALHLRDRQLMGTLLDELENDPEALSFHIGYSRIYYGDQHAGASGWRDDGTVPCDRFFLATVRQLGNPFYASLWPMSARTARVLLADPQRRQYLEQVTKFGDHLATLGAFARRHAADPWPVLARESRALGVLVDSLGGGEAVLDDSP